MPTLMTTMESTDTVNSPGLSDNTSALMTTLGNESDHGTASRLKPMNDSHDADPSYEMEKAPKPREVITGGLVKDLKILYVENCPIDSNYETVASRFERFGIIKEIRMKPLTGNWEAWISFSSCAEALEASKNLSDIKINDRQLDGYLCDRTPKNMDVYKPEQWSNDVNVAQPVVRNPKPPTWLIATGKDGKYNYYRMSKYIQKKVGSIKSSDITRYGRQSVLIHAKNETQALMLQNIKTEGDEILKEIKPHLNFSYGKGVVFDRDLYEFTEEEILDMCPGTVWKVNKVPRTSMIVLTFQDPNIPDHVTIENVWLHVREFKPRPMQCYNCFRYGHPSSVCKDNKICINCSSPEHGPCSNSTKCSNCKEDHKANDKRCTEYKKEEAALLKANAEHLSVGYAKKLLGHQLNYAKAAKGPQPSTNPATATIGPRNLPRKINPPPKPSTNTKPVKSASVSQNILPATQEVIENIQDSLESLPDLREDGIPPIKAPPPSILSTPVQVALQAISLPDSIPQQGAVNKRVRTPSDSPPHMRKKANSPQRTKENKVINAEIHRPSNIKKKEEKRNPTNKPQISRKVNSRSNK